MPGAAQVVEAVSDRARASAADLPAASSMPAPRNPEGVRALRNAMPAAVEAAGIAPRLAASVATATAVPA
ncbi:hypothetical protein GCM10009819_24430 [Agromyces tropicus]|uniref:Uncharacterized protein n=1 Tax=Agromyces tropicus TaxID=555371 RepID=A0ABN2UK40_9MICO